jgi:predicted nucleic acid-binding protein
MAYLVDTNIMVDFTRGNAKAADYLDSLGGACLLSSITALELIAGARSQREVNDLEWCARRDSNPRPTGSKPAALSN